MRHLFFLICFLGTVVCFGQGKHKVSPALKVKMDTAAARYVRAMGDPKALAQILSLIDGVIKKDSLYYDAWVNKLHIECQLNKYPTGLKTVRTMNRLFPHEADAMMLGGVMEYHMGNKIEASYYFNRLLSLDNTFLKGHEKDPKYKAVWINKGIVLILLDRTAEGKAILQKIYDAEPDPYVQSYIGFYIQKSKDEIIADKVPGK